MADFDWVRARSECSAVAVFQQLKLGAQGDVDKINSMRRGDPLKFSLVEEGDRFSVIREEQGEKSMSVTFSLENSVIKVSGSSTGQFSAIVTLNDEGACKLRIMKEDDDEFLDFWQVRRKALEYLFWPIRVRVEHIGKPKKQK